MLNKKLNPIITELFITGRKLNISLVLIRQSYFAVPINIRLNYTHYLIRKVPKKQDLEEITFTGSWNIDFKDFMKFCKKCTAKPYSFLVIDATLASDNHLCFRRNHAGRI